MTLQAHIHLEAAGQPWLYITAQPFHIGGPPPCILDMPLDLSSKSSTKAEIDFAHQRTGIPRPDLYDAVRTYRRGERSRPNR